MHTNPEDRLIEYERARRKGQGLDGRLTPVQLSVLRYVVEHSPVAETALCRDKAISPGTLSKAISSLVQRGLITREIGQDDGRRRILQTTKVGTSALSAWDESEMALALTSARRKKKDKDNVDQTPRQLTLTAELEQLAEAREGSKSQ